MRTYIPEATVLYAFSLVWRVSSCRQVMTRRTFNQLTSIMPRISRNVVILFGIGLSILTVWADINGQPDLNRTQVTLDAQPLKDNATEVPVICVCQFFVQSWKTSHMIRLPMSTY